MSKRRPLIPTLPVDDVHRCPCCEKGILNERSICQRCGVAIAQGSSYLPHPWTARGGFKRQDQDRVGPHTDYARYKEDHGE